MKTIIIYKLYNIVIVKLYKIIKNQKITFLIAEP